MARRSKRKSNPNGPDKNTASPKSRVQLSAAKKLLFALLATTGFFLGLELLLAGVGTQPILHDEDPYVGFASYIPLFAEQNETVGPPVMATADNKLKWFNPQRFLKEKPEQAYRVFCVGGSTTYGRPYDDVTSFCGWLRQFLTAADASRPWEVINAGGISYASYRVAMLMEELVDYDPDLFIIYTGHNEFLEGRTYASLKQMPAALRGLGGLLSHTRTYAAVKRLIRKPDDKTPEADAQRELLPSEVKTRLDGGVGPDAYQRDDTWRQQVLQHYRFNLERMVDIARSAGARVVMVTPASNLRDCSPFKSQHRSGLAENDLRRWRSRLDVAAVAQSEGQFDQALAALNEAATIDDRFAQLHFLRGQVLDAMGRHGDAKAAWIRARDEDICPLRALTPMREIVSEVAEQRDVPLIDFIALVEARSDHGIPGENLFFDHVHPTIEGNRLLALSLLDEMARDGTVTLDNSWGEQPIAEVVRRVESGLDRQAHGLALRNLAKVLSWAGKDDEANRLALRAKQFVSDDANSFYLAGNALVQQGQLDQALLQFKRALAIDPDYVEVHNSLGAAYQMLGDLDAAAAAYKEAIRLKPDFAPAHGNLAALLNRQGKPDQAVTHFRKAIRLNPNYSKARNNLGVLLRGQGQLEPAAAEFEAALRIDPQLAEAHHNLGLVRAKQDNHDQAQALFEQALRIKPDYAPAHVDLARLLQRHGNDRDAATHLRHALQQKRPPLEAAVMLAWILATSDDATLRDGQQAVRWAQSCVKATGTKDPNLLATLAAAHAEAGDFEEAIRWQEKALALAPPALKPAYRSRLELYRAQQPYRQNL